MYSVKEILENALKPLVRNAFYPWRIESKGFCGALQINVISNEFNTPEKRQEVARLIESAKDEILEVLGPGFTSLRISVETSRPCSYFSLPSFDRVDGDDYEDSNPNWPSKTGNPSGGGRGNNPPRR